MLYAPGGRVVDHEDLSVDSVKARDHGDGPQYPRLVEVFNVLCQ